MYEVLSNKKEELDKYRPLPPELVTNLDDWFRVELIYTSNAIEGNTLSRKETALVVEKGLTVTGKSLHEHFEVHNHSKALSFIQSLLDKRSSDITEEQILEIHRLILQGIDDDNTGRFRTVAVRISGSMIVFPNYVKIPALMTDLIASIFQNTKQYHPVELAILAHYELVTIHPFSDANGRAARLLMNLILIQNGYPPAIISKRDRDRYITSLEQAQLGGSRDNFDKLIIRAINKSFTIYLNAAKGEDAPIKPIQKLFKIGELAKLTGQSVSTIRYWTSKGLLTISNKTEKGYSLYEKKQVDQIKKILTLKSKRYNLIEIQQLLKSNND